MPDARARSAIPVYGPGPDQRDSGRDRQQSRMVDNEKGSRSLGTEYRPGAVIVHETLDLLRRQNRLAGDFPGNGRLEQRAHISSRRV
jgi:hypothetical protein